MLTAELLTHCHRYDRSGDQVKSLMHSKNHLLMDYAFDNGSSTSDISLNNVNRY